MSHFKKIYPVFLFFVLYGCGPMFIPFEKFDPDLKWEVIESSHFLVYFHQNEKEAAQKASKIAEDVHQSLSQQFQWIPRTKTHLIITDHLDSPFGEATPFPENIITISLTQPADGLGIQPIRYEDWLRLVIIHEYTHILHLDTVAGFPLWMRKIFGRNPVPLFSLPNVWQPLWMIEGLAVYMETTHGASDRMDNTFTEMVLRSALLDHQFDPIDQASGALTSWPDGLVPYLYGAKFYQFIAKKFGSETLTEISRKNSQNAIPFRIESTAMKVLKQDYPDLWSEWMEELNQKYTLEASRIEKEGLTPYLTLTVKGRLAAGGRYSPDGQKIVYTDVTPDHYPSFHMIDRDGKNDHLLSLRNSGYDSAWSPDGTKIVYSQLERFRNYYLYSDLYSYELSTGETKRLSYGLRAKEVDYSPEGHFLVFVQQELGKNRLSLWDFEKSETVGLTPYSDTFLISTPRWLNNEKDIVFSGWEKGNQNIYLFKRDTRELRQLTADSFQNLTPAPGENGGQILFCSDRTGVYNLFSYDLKTKETRQLTHLLGGASFPSVSPDQKSILFLNYTAKGFELSVMESQKGQVAVNRPGENIPENQRKELMDDTAVLNMSRPYSPVDSILPHFWVPWGGVDEGGIQGGAWLTGEDVLRKHQYLLVGLYGFQSHRFSYQFDYLNDQFYPTIELGVFDWPKYYANLLSNSANQRGNYWERQQTSKAGLLIPWLKLHSKHYLKIGYEKTDFSALSSIPSGFTPPQSGTLYTIKGGWIYDSSEEYSLSISKEEGRTVQLLIEDSDKSLGSDYNILKYKANLREYHPFFVPNGVVAGQLTGGIAQGDRLIQRAFQLGGPLIIDQPFLDQSEFSLRGYPTHQFVGQNLIVANLEYRFPFPLIERGSGTIPFFIKRLHGSLFTDYGNSWDEGTSIDQFKMGAGFELLMDFNLFYHLPLRGRIGTAHGLNSSGETQVYLSMGNSF